MTIPEKRLYLRWWHWLFVVPLFPFFWLAVLILLSSCAQAFEPGDVMTTNLICLDQDVTITIARSIDQHFFDETQPDAALRISAGVEAELCASHADDDFEFKLVRQVWLGEHVEVWEVKPVDKDGPPAYVGFKRHDRSAKS